MDKLDQGHLHPPKEHPILTGRESNPGRDEHSSKVCKEIFEQLVNRYTEHPHRFFFWFNENQRVMDQLNIIMLMYNVKYLSYMVLV
jgi:hypothetical protein